MSYKSKYNATIFLMGAFIFFFGCSSNKIELSQSTHDLVFEKLANRWDEAVPLGNGMLGALVWQNGDKLRFSLDRADLWDLRPMENLATPEWSYEWVYNQWLKKDYKPVQDRFDKPYNELPAPTKIPAGALEFATAELGPVESVRLFVNNATCRVRWKNGALLTTFVHGEAEAGWFKFEGIENDLDVELKSPAYTKEITDRPDVSVTRRDLQRLGYSQGKIEKNGNSIVYDQEGWGGFKYQIFVEWQQNGDTIEGCWSISSEFTGWEKTATAKENVNLAQKSSFSQAWLSHNNWWQNYWKKSQVNLPDSILQKQYYLEMYKFGSAARADAPPISLQAVWTADDGLIPPWKGDFHHDLNTQLSYWPAYAGNQLDLEAGFVNWLWKYKPTFEKYTKDYYGKNGLNVPGVSTLTGEPMGGWIQYSFGPTVAAWLAHHFYLHWQFTRDRKFLEEKVYPWIRDVAIFLDEISIRDKKGYRKLPISSSPEIFNNSWRAWFDQTTNYDLALIKWTLLKASELADELGKTKEARDWLKMSLEWPDLEIDEQTGLMFAPGFPYDESHRHFSHLMAFHPLGLLDMSHNLATRQTIKKTLENLEAHGSDWWTGYSFSWQGNLYARALDGEKAAEALRTFAACFCLPNSFHVNGDQSGTGKSKFTYRPFTLEGNFAFASGIQEMLIQSHTGVVKIFPAIPNDWQNVSFEQLRTYGAFLVSAKNENGLVSKVEIQSTAGEPLKLENPFDGEFEIKGGEYVKQKNNVLLIKTVPGQVITLTQVN